MRHIIHNIDIKRQGDISMDKSKKISLANEISKHITTHILATWPGFTAVPFILYDDKNQVAIGTEWPEHYTQEQEGVWVAEGFDPQLMGNTSIIYHGVHVAIWDTRTWPENLDISKAASSIAHEMFHAFQHTNMNIPWANELLLPQYPHSARSVALVIEENELLAEILANPDKTSIEKCLRNIFALRKQREFEIGADFFEYDKRCESIEGTAAYVEIRMMAIVEGKTPYESATSYLPVLMNNSKLLNNYRHRCYTAGLILCLASDVMWQEWQTEWTKSEKTIFDWIKDKLTLPESEIAVNSSDLEIAGELLSIYQSEKEKKINEFTAQPLISFEGAVQLIGFDPMNLTCIGDRCLHIHGKLRFGENEQMVVTPFLEEYGDTVLDVKRISFPNLKIDHNGSRIIVEGLGEMNGHIEELPDGMRCVVVK